jgi:hypothetical protein
LPDVLRKPAKSFLALPQLLGKKLRNVRRADSVQAKTLTPQVLQKLPRSRHLASNNRGVVCELYEPFSELNQNGRVVPFW